MRLHSGCSAWVVVALATVHAVCGTTLVYSNTSVLANSSHYEIVEAGTYSADGGSLQLAADITISASNVRLTLQSMTATVLVKSASSVTLTILQSTVGKITATNANLLNVHASDSSTLSSISHLGASGSIEVTMVDSFIDPALAPSNTTATAFLVAATGMGNAKLTLSNVLTASTTALDVLCYHSGAGRVDVVVDTSSSVECGTLLWVDAEAAHATVTVANARVSLTATRLLHASEAKNVALTLTTATVSGGSQLLFASSPDTISVDMTGSDVQHIGGATALIQTSVLKNAQLSLNGNTLSGYWSTLASFETMSKESTKSDFSDLSITTTITSNTINVGATTFTLLSWPPMHLKMHLNGVVVFSASLLSLTVFHVPAVFEWIESGATDYIAGNDITVLLASAAVGVVPNPTSSGKGVTCSTGGISVCYNSVVAAAALKAHIVLAYGVTVAGGAQLTRNSMVSTAMPSADVQFFRECIFPANVLLTMNALDVVGPTSLEFALLGNTVGGGVVARNNLLYSTNTAYTTSTLCNGVSSSTKTVACGNTVRLDNAVTVASYNLFAGGSFVDVTLKHTIDMSATTGMTLANVNVLRRMAMVSLIIESGTSVKSSSTATIRLASEINATGAVTVSGVAVDMSSTSAQTFSFAIIESLTRSDSLSIASSSIAMTTTDGNVFASLCLKCNASGTVSVKNNAITLQKAATAEAVVLGVVWSSMSDGASSLTGTIRGNQLSAAPLNQNPSLTGASCPSGANVCGNTAKIRGAGTATLTLCDGCGAERRNRLVTVRSNPIGARNFQGNLTVNLCRGCVALHKGRTHIMDHDVSIVNGSHFTLNFGGLNVTDGSAVVRWNEITGAPFNVSHLGATWLRGCGDIDDSVSKICGNSAVVDFGYVVTTMSRYHTGVVQSVGATFCADCHIVNGTLLVADNFFETMNTTGASVVYCNRCSATGLDDTPDSGTLTVLNNTGLTHMAEATKWVLKVNGYDRTFTSDVQVYDESVVVCSDCKAHHPHGVVEIANNSFVHARNPTRSDNVTTVRSRSFQNYFSATVCSKCATDGSTSELRAVNNSLTAVGQFYGTVRFCTECSMNHGSVVVAANLVALEYIGYSSRLDVQVASIVSTNGTVHVVNNSLPISNSATLDFFTVNATPGLCTDLRLQVVAANNSANANNTANHSFICGNVLRTFSTSALAVDVTFCTDCIATEDGRQIQVLHNALHTRTPGNSIDMIMCDGCEGNVFFAFNVLHSVDTFTTVDAAFCKLCVITSNQTLFRQVNNSITGTIRTAKIAMAGFEAKDTGHAMVCDNGLIAYAAIAVTHPAPIWPEVPRTRRSVSGPNCPANDTNTSNCTDGSNTTTMAAWCNVPTGWSVSGNNTVLIRYVSSLDATTCTGCHTAGNGTLHVLNQTFYSAAPYTTVTSCRDCSVGGSAGYGDLYVANNGFVVNRSTYLTARINDVMQSDSRHVVRHNEVFERPSYDEQPLSTRDQRFALCDAQYQPMNGSLMCGNVVQSIGSRTVVVVFVRSLTARSGDPVVISDNKVTTVLASVLSLSWCYECMVVGSMLFVVRNYGHTNGTTDVTVLQGGVRAYNNYRFTLTNNHFVATKSSTLPSNDAAFVAAAFERVPESWVLDEESGSFNNSVVSVGASIVETSMCRLCWTESGGHIRVVHNEARISNATSGVVSLCTDCRLRAKGYLSIFDNVVDTLNVSTVATFALRDMQTWWTPLRVYNNLWVGFNTTWAADNENDAQLYTKTNVASCLDAEQTPFLERRVCGNTFHVRDATNVAVTLCRGLYARSLVVLEENKMHLTDARGDATAVGCLHCRAEPRSAGYATAAAVPSRTNTGTTGGSGAPQLPTGAPTTPSANASAPKRNSTISRTTSASRTISLPDRFSHTKSVSLTYTETVTASQSLPTTKVNIESGVAVFNNLFNVQRYGAATYTLLGGASWQQAPCGAWGNAMSAVNTTSVIFTMLHYFSVDATAAVVQDNVVTSNPADYASSTAYNVTQNVLECPIGVCRNRCLAENASATAVTLGDGVEGYEGIVSRNQIDVVTTRTAAVIASYNASTIRLTVAHNAIALDTSLATIYVAKLTETDALYAASNPINATGPAATTPTMPVVGSACPVLAAAGSVVCNNSIAAHVASFDVHVVQSATVQHDVTAENHAAHGVQVTNFSYTLLESISSRYGSLSLRDNDVVMAAVGDAVANESSCSERCTASYANATTASTGASPDDTQAFSTNQTAKVTFCTGCNVATSLDIVNNAVDIAGARRMHCNHCLLTTPTDFYSYSVAAFHAQFTAQPERTLRTGMIDVIVCDRCTSSAQSGGSIVATNNNIKVQDADVRVCPTAADIPVCPSYAMGRSLTDANTARCVILSRASVRGVLTVQSNSIVVNNLNEDSYVSLVLVSELSLDAQVASTIAQNTATASMGIVHTFICATCTSSNPTTSPTTSTLSLRQNTVDLTGNDTSFAVCIGCNAYRQITASDNTVTGRHGKRGSGAVCINCYCDDEATFSATGNIITFTNVTTFQAVIGFSVRVYGASLSVVKNGISGSSGTPIAFGFGGCPNAAFLLCKNEIRGFQVQRVNTSICRDCRLSNATPTATQYLTVSENVVNVQDVVSAAITLAEGSVSGIKTICSVVSNVVTFKNMLSARLVPFMLSSTYSDTDAKQNILDFDNVSTMDGYLVGGSKGSPGRSSDTICVQNNLLTTSSSATASVVGSPAGCNIAVISNTIRVYGGSNLGGWSLLGSAGARGTYRLGSNAIAATLDILSIISSIDPDTQLPSYASGATYELNGNAFTGKNITIGVTSSDNQVLITGGSLSYLNMYGVTTNNNYATNVVLTGVTLEGIVLSGGLGSFTMAITSSTFTADHIVAADGATTNGLSILFVATSHASARRRFDALGDATPVSSSAVNVVYAENSTLSNSNITVIGGSMDLSTGALVALKNSTVVGGRMHWTSVALTDARLLNMDNSTLKDGTIAVVDSAVTSSTEILVATSDCSATSNFVLNVTGTTFAPKGSIPSPNAAEIESATDLTGLGVYYDTSAFTGYKALHNTEARYSLFLACTSWEGVSGYELNRTAYFPYSRSATLKVFSWAGAVCFSRTPTPSISKSPEELSVTDALPITDSQRLSLTRSLQPTASPSSTASPTKTASASPSQSGTPTPTPSSSPTESATLYGDPKDDPFLLILLCSTFGGLLLIGLGVFFLWRYYRPSTAGGGGADASDSGDSDVEAQQTRGPRAAKKKGKKASKKGKPIGSKAIASEPRSAPPLRNPLEPETEMV